MDAKKYVLIFWYYCLFLHFWKQKRKLSSAFYQWVSESTPFWKIL